MNTCDQGIGFSSFHSPKWNIGFRAYVVKCNCPKCGEERKLIKRWRGPTPNGGIICGAIIKDLTVK